MPLEPQGDELDSTKSFRMLSPGASISHYKIVEKIGAGGMGVVYKAQDIRLGRTVALKFLPSQLICDAETKVRFEHEARAASALNHNNITTVYDIDEVEDQCFISMEYIEGKSIKELLKEKTLSVDEVLGTALQIGDGLNAAHKKDIVHRDVKSDNIMLTDEGVVKIMDFGLARLKGGTKLTKTGTTMGSLQYMSPEQAQGMDVDQRSDVFSFGVILYEMITGQLPFKGEHEAAVIHSIVNETPEPLARYKANVPEGLQRIVDKALQKDVTTRYQSAAEVVADLKGLQKQTTVAVVAKPKKRLLPFIVPASIVFVIVLFFLILKPFQVQVVPEKSAIAKENSLAIMYFDNLVDTEDKERLGEIVTNLLITDLSESEYVNVVSSQRLYDILKLLGREGEKEIDREVASQVATKAGARWMLLGNILRVEPQTVITTQLVNVETGQVEASQRVTVEMKEEVFSLVDKLTVEIKKDLSLPAAAQQVQVNPSLVSELETVLNINSGLSKTESVTSNLSIDEQLKPQSPLSESKEIDGLNYEFIQDDTYYSFRGSFFIKAKFDSLISVLYDYSHLVNYGSGAKSIELVRQGENWYEVCYTYRKLIIFENKSTWRRTLKPDEQKVVFEMISNKWNTKLLPEVLSSTGYYQIAPAEEGYKVEYFQECKLKPSHLKGVYINKAKKGAIEFLLEFKEYTEKICH